MKYETYQKMNQGQRDYWNWHYKDQSLNIGFYMALFFIAAFVFVLYASASVFALNEMEEIGEQKTVERINNHLDKATAIFRGISTLGILLLVIDLIWAFYVAISENRWLKSEGLIENKPWWRLS